MSYQIHKHGLCHGVNYLTGTVGIKESNSKHINYKLQALTISTLQWLSTLNDNIINSSRQRIISPNKKPSHCVTDVYRMCAGEDALCATRAFWSLTNILHFASGLSANWTSDKRDETMTNEATNTQSKVWTHRTQSRWQPEGGRELLFIIKFGQTLVFLENCNEKLRLCRHSSRVIVLTVVTRFTRVSCSTGGLKKMFVAHHKEEKNDSFDYLIYIYSNSAHKQQLMARKRRFKL